MSSGDVIRALLGSLTNVAGRENQTYVVGHGLTQEGVEYLSKKLACLTFGDLNSILDMKSLESEEARQTYSQLRDLTKGLVRKSVVHT